MDSRMSTVPSQTRSSALQESLVLQNRVSSYYDFFGRVAGQIDYPRRRIPIGKEEVRDTPRRPVDRS